MKMGVGFIGSGGLDKSLYGLLKEAGFQDEIAFVLDAGSIGTYNPSISSTAVRDISGNDQHFSIVGGVTFVGTAGALTDSEYFNYDGGTSYLVEASDLTFAEDWIKIGGAFTLLGICYIPDNFGTDRQWFLNTNLIDSTGRRGIVQSFITETDITRPIQLTIGGGANRSSTLSTTVVTHGLEAPMFFSFGADEIAETFSFSGSSGYEEIDPVSDNGFSSTGSSSPYSIGRGVETSGSVTKYCTNGNRLYCIAGINAYLTEVQLESISDLLKTHRFPGL